MLITKKVKLFDKDIPIEELSLCSHKLVDVECDNCGLIKQIKYQSYNNSTKNNTEKYYCNNKDCINKKRKIAIQKKYGVDNISQLESIKNKKIETCQKNFGVCFPTQSNVVKNKTKKTNLTKHNKEWITQTDYFKEKSKIKNLEKYGVEYSTQSDEIKNKTKNTILEKYNVEYLFQSEEIKNKAKITNLKKYGTEYSSQSDEIKKKMKNTNLKLYGVEYASQSEEIKNKTKISVNKLDLNEIKNKHKKTNIEKYNSEYYSQSEFYKNIVNNRKIITLSNRYSLDIIEISHDIIYSKCCECNKIFNSTYQQLYNRYIYNVKLCTLCNPINSLSDKEKNLREFILSNYSDIIVFNNRKIITPLELDIYLPKLKIAFEFNGLYWHSDIYKDKNYHLIKTELCEQIGIQLIHIWEDDWIYKQDIVKSIILNKLNIFKSEIYANICKIKEISDEFLVKEFLDKNYINGYIKFDINIGLYYNDELVALGVFEKNENNYTLYTICNKLNINVVGSHDKILTYFIKNINFSKIFTYINRSYFNGDYYLKNNFLFESKTDPNCYYLINNKKEKQNNDKENTLRIYDSGNLVLIQDNY